MPCSASPTTGHPRRPHQAGFTGPPHAASLVGCTCRCAPVAVAPLLPDSPGSGRATASPRPSAHATAWHRTSNTRVMLHGDPAVSRPPPPTPPPPSPAPTPAQTRLPRSQRSPLLATHDHILYKAWSLIRIERNVCQALGGMRSSREMETSADHNTPLQLAGAAYAALARASHRGVNTRRPGGAACGGGRERSALHARTPTALTSRPSNLQGIAVDGAIKCDAIHVVTAKTRPASYILLSYLKHRNENKYINKQTKTKKKTRKNAISHQHVWPEKNAAQHLSRGA